MQIEVPRYEGGLAGLPSSGRAVVMTNSERTTAACSLRWLFAYGYRLKPQARQAPLEFGRAVHAFTEDVHLWWMHHDTEYPGDGTTCVWCGGTGRDRANSPPDASGPCTHCDGTGGGPVVQAARLWQQHANDDLTGEYTLEHADLDAVRLQRCTEGWLHVWGTAPPTEYRVVAPELQLAVPIRGPGGKPYQPRIWLVPEGNGWRMASPGEAHLPGAQVVRWPWYQAMTLDCLLQHRDTGGLWVWETKTAKSPERRMQQFGVDPQVAGYVWGAAHAVRQGLVPGIDPSTPVHGYLVDVLYNGMQHDPKLLKPQKVKALGPDGEPFKVKGRWQYVLDANGDPVEQSALSTASNAGVPSWRFRKAIQRLGLAEADYADHLLDLAVTVDPRLYLRDYGTSGPEVGQRYARELYAVARQLAAHRRNAAQLRTPEQRDTHFPRQAVPCLQGYGCAYRGPCLQDGDMVRRNFDVADGLRWRPDNDTDNPQAQEQWTW